LPSTGRSTIKKIMLAVLAAAPMFMLVVQANEAFGRLAGI
jgi:hypothetical protein